MTILIDPPTDYPGKGKWAHMVSDLGGPAGLAELHAFADDLGLKREWFQNPAPGMKPHYDIRPSKYERAIDLANMGDDVRFVESRELVEAIRGKYPQVITKAMLSAWAKEHGVQAVDDPTFAQPIKGVMICTLQKAGGGPRGHGRSYDDALLSLYLTCKNAPPASDGDPPAFYCKR